MFNSKEIKKGYFCKPADGWWFWIKEHTVYWLEDRYHRYTERIGRSWAFARIGWLNYDFDFSTTWDLLAFKMKRIHKTLEEGHCVQEKEDMGALLEAIAICERLSLDQYKLKYHEEHDKKWGELETNLDEVASRDEKGHPLSYRWKSWRKGVKPENEEQERQEFRQCWEKGENDRLADLDRLNVILKTYSMRWWD
jgi:hypothetical protein